MNKARLSIVIPCYNSEKWIGETLESIQRNECHQVETIVIDDGSTDDSVEIISGDYPWVKLIQTENRGCSAARGLGLELAEGKWIKFLDADDLLVERFLDNQLALAEKSTADVVYCNWQRLVSDDIGQWSAADKVKRQWQDIHPTDIEIAFFTDMWCPTAAYMWRTAFLNDRHPGWHPKLPVIQDARFALDAAIVGGRFLHDDQVGVLYRVHSGGSVSTRSRSQFLLNVWLSAKEISEKWNSELINDERLNSIKGVYRQVVRGMLEINDDHYMEALQDAREQCPDFTISDSRLFRVATKGLGLKNAELLRKSFRMFYPGSYL